MKKYALFLLLLVVLTGCEGDQMSVASPSQPTEAVPTPLVSVTPEQVQPTPSPKVSEPGTEEKPVEPTESLPPEETQLVPMETEPEILPEETRPVDEQTRTPSDEAVLAAYHQAVEALGWFQLCTLPTAAESQTEWNGAFYSRVDYAGLNTVADLRGYLKNLFSDELVETLLPADGVQYVDINGALYVQQAARGSDITRGGETLQVLRNGNEDLRTVRVTVEILDPERDFVITGSEDYDFPYEKVGDKWIFTSFSLVR